MQVAKSQSGGELDPATCNEPICNPLITILQLPDLHRLELISRLLIAFRAEHLRLHTSCVAMPAVTRGELARLALSSPAPGGSITTTLASDQATSSSDSSDSDEDDDSEEDDEDDSEEDDSGEDDTRPNLSSLLLKAKLAARQHLQFRKQLDWEAAKRTGDDLAGNEEMVRFGSDDESDSEDEEEEEDGADSGDDDEGT